MEVNNIHTLTTNPSIDREWLVDTIEFDVVLRNLESRVDVGGKGFNVSRMLITLDQKSTALGFVGGKNGSFLSDGLRALGINTDFVWVEGESRVNISIVNRQNHHYIKVNEAGPSISIDEQNQLIDKVNKLTQKDDWWVLSGSLPPNVPDNYYAKLIEIIHARGGKAVLDANGEALAKGCEAVPFLVKPNVTELEELTKMPLTTQKDILKAVDLLHEAGVQIIIVSMGDQGAILSTKNSQWWSKSPAVEEINPIGSGDSLLGGFIWAIKQGHTLAESLSWGVASGAATASLGGTAIGSKPEIERLHTRNQIQRLK